MAEAVRRHVLGTIFRIFREHKGWTPRQAAHAAGLGSHMTWRRVESGEPCRSFTYNALDELCHLRVGTVVRALADDDALVELAGRLGVDTSDIAEGTPARTWLARVAMQTMPEAQMGEPTVSVGEPEALTVTVATVLRRLIAIGATSPAKQAAVASLSQVLPELFDEGR